MSFPYRIISSVIFLVLVSFSVTAQQQEKCGTMRMDSIRRAQHPNAPSLQDFENWLQDEIEQYKQKSATAKQQVITIPVVVHVVHDGDPVGQNENLSQAQVNSQIEILNEDFRRLNSDTTDTPANFQPVAADIEIEFCLAQVDPQGNVLNEPGIDRYNGGQSTWSQNDIDNTLKPNTIWDPNRYFNIWTVDFGNSGLLGYAQFPEASGLQGMPSGSQNAQTDGVVVRHTAFGRVGNVNAPADKGRTATHEVGHWLGLRHIWGDGDCSQDDFCNDTPDADASTSGCPNSQSSCGSVDMIENYMDYTDDACMNLFTADQKSRMRTVMNNSPRRVDLLSSNVCQVLDKEYVSGQVVDSATGTGIPNAEVLISSNNYNFSIQTDNSGFFADSVFEGTYDIYAGKWGYVTNQVANVNLQDDSSGIVIELAEGYYDDFIFDFNWSVNSTASTGIWEKGDPIGTFYNSAPSNPEDDIQTDYGKEAYVTGNGGGNVGDDDIDDGVTTLTSPVFDLSNYNNPKISYHRWFFNDAGGSPPNDSLEVSISNGNTTVTVETIDADSVLGQWRFNEFRVSDYINPTANMQIIYEASDDAADGHLVEAAVDVFQVTDSVATNTAPITGLNANPKTVCRGDTVNFFDSSTNGPTSWDWSFPGGTPSSSNAEAPQVVYTSAGTYDVTLIATNSYGSDTITKNSFITVDTLAGGFTANKTSVCPGEVVNFTDQTTCNPTSYQWSFPNGNPSSSTSANPSVSYSASGTYDVQLIVSNNFDTDTIIKQNSITVGSGQSLPFQEDFESGNLSTNNWQIKNPDNGFTWEFQSVSGNTPGGTAVRVNCFNYGDPGQRDGLITPALDFSNYSDIQLTFEHAYRRSSTNDQDSLIVYLSTDCGVSYPYRIYAAGENGSGTFATNYTTNTDWVPSSTDDWCLTGVGASCDTVDLSAFSGNPNVRLKFETYNDNGNNIYLDNINITGTSTITPPDAQFTSSPDSSCAPLTVTFTDQSTNSPTSWQWSFPGGSPSSSTSQNPTVVYNNPGTYDVTLVATNSDGSDTLTKQNQVTVYPHPNPVGSTSDVSCPGDADGSITLSVNTGTSPFSYQWSTGDTSKNITNLGSGNYDVTVTDANGCTGTNSFTITEPNAFNTTVTTSPETCGQSDGSASINATGGTTPYNYSWSNGQTSASINGVSSGIYYVTLTDDNLCEVVDTANISSINGPSLSASITNVACFGGSSGAVNLTVTGGSVPYTYNWSSGDTVQDLTQLTAGSYSVTVEDDNGCTSFATYPVSEPSQLQLSVTSSDASCGNADGSAAVSVSGGVTPYSYNWSNNATDSSIANLNSGTYTVTVIDDNGCSQTATASVSNANGPNVASNITHVSCHGSTDGAISLTISGGTSPYDVNWSNGDTSQDVTGLSPGNYQYTVTDGNNCQTVQSLAIAEPDSVTLTLSKTDATCGNANGSAVAQGTGGSGQFTYQWSNGATGPAISNAAPGGYGVTATDTNGCSSSSTVFINNVPGPSATSTATNVNCNGGSSGSVDLQVNAGTPPYDYNWSTGTTTQDLNGIPSGTYSVTITDDNNCQAFQSETVSEPSAINISLQISSSGCGNQDGEIKSVVSGGLTPYDYNWSNGDTTSGISNLSGGNYQLTVTDDAGCTETASGFVNALQGPTLSTSKSDVTCYADSNGAAAVSVTNGTAPYSFQWSNGNTQSSINGLGAGTYSVTVTDSINCEATESVIINQPSATSLNVSTSNDECGTGNGMAVASAAGGAPPYNYQWSNGDTGSVINKLTSGSYSVTLTDQNGCTVNKTVTIEGNSQLQLTTSTTSDTSGQGMGSATVNVTGGTSPYSYQWDDDDNQTTSTATDLSPGLYIVTVTDSNGCQASTSVLVDNITGIADQSSEGSLFLYPNPAQKQVTIDAGAADYRLEYIEVFDPVGEKLMHVAVHEDQAGPKQIALSHLNAGLYFFRIKTDEHLVVKKVIITR